MKILTQKMLGAQGLATEELWLRSFLLESELPKPIIWRHRFIGDHPLHIVYLLVESISQGG